MGDEAKLMSHFCYDHDKLTKLTIPLIYYIIDLLHRYNLVTTIMDCGLKWHVNLAE